MAADPLAGLKAHQANLQTSIDYGDTKIPKKELDPLILGLIPAAKLGPFKPSYLKGLVSAEIEKRSGVEESIISESVYSRWQKLIKG
mgnify:FL=1